MFFALSEETRAWITALLIFCVVILWGALFVVVSLDGVRRSIEAKMADLSQLYHEQAAIIIHLLDPLDQRRVWPELVQSLLKVWVEKDGRLTEVLKAAFEKIDTWRNDPRFNSYQERVVTLSPVVQSLVEQIRPLRKLALELGLDPEQTETMTRVLMITGLRSLRIRRTARTLESLIELCAVKILQLSLRIVPV